MKTPSEKKPKEKHLFIGCLPSSNDLPAQFPENGGRSPAMLKWYAEYSDMSPVTCSILKEIVSYLNFNDFYTEYREIRQETLMAGTRYKKTVLIKSIQSLIKDGIIESVKLAENKRKYRLTRKIPDAYIAYVKEAFPHKFNTDTVVRHADYANDRSSPRELRVVRHADYAMSATRTTSCLSVPPLSHPNSKTPISPFGETIAGESPQTPGGIESDKYYLGEGLKLGCLVIEIDRYSKAKRTDKVALINLIQKTVKPPIDVYDYFMCKVTNNQKIGMDYDAILDDIATFLAEREQKQ